MVAGLCLALRRFGTMPLAEVIRPAISAARFGYVPGRRNRLGLAENAADWRRDFPETARLLLKDGRPPRRGERVTNRELARTLEELAEDGQSLFYRGPLGKKIAARVEELGGCLTAQDMRGYRARVVKPYAATYRDCRLFTPPLAAGGLTDAADTASARGLRARDDDRCRTDASPRGGDEALLAPTSRALRRS